MIEPIRLLQLTYVGHHLVRHPASPMHPRLTPGLMQVLPEKEARVITAQVCSGLAYLNNTPRRIIHM